MAAIISRMKSEKLLKEFGDLFVTDQQNYKALHRSLSTPPPPSHLTMETESFPK